MEEIKALVERSQAGDLGAYGRLVSRFQDMACGYAYALLGDFHLAEDAAQEAFVEAFRKLGQVRDTAAFPGWFRRVVMTQCHRITRRKSLPTQPMEAEPPSRVDDPAEALAKAELRDSVLAAIQSLPEHERAVTTLFYINGYSQADIAGFLEVPVTTVKSRLHTSRCRLRERMMEMVGDTLRTHAPDERFGRQVIERLLARPNLVEIEGHPVRQAWEAMRQALPEYEVVEGEEVEDAETVAEAEDHAWDLAYRLGEERALRYQMTTVTLSALAGRTPPVRLLAAGRVFRPCREDATHSKAFHQVDGVCVMSGASVEAFRATCERALTAALPGARIEWREHDYSLVVPGLVADACLGEQRREVLGGGMLKPDTLARKGHDPEEVSGFAWGLSLERLAMLRHGIDDVRKLRHPPYVTE